MEELQTVVGKMAEDAASGNDSPAGIPPQRAKPAGVKPDPKARPFTPGVGLCTFVLTRFESAEEWPSKKTIKKLHKKETKKQGNKDNSLLSTQSKELKFQICCAT